MTDPSSEDDGMLREWAPLTTLLHQIPHKAQRGLFTGDLNLTCVAALPEFLAIGTNHGLVYWYNRSTHELQRLRCENTVCAITCVHIVSTVDYMVAAGTDNGIVTVFLVPKALPDNIPDEFKSSVKKQVERYTVAGLHSAPVTSVEWSTNGMKLFSGDLKGLVVLTEIDFYMHLSKSVEVLNEKYEVVQLSYSSSTQMLLVSTLYRSIVCQKDDRNNQWKVAQVGNKERKMLGKMGATFYVERDKPRIPIIYSSRPGLRLWLSNKEGVVGKTLIFKDAVFSKHPEILLLNPTRSRSRLSRGEPQFGPLLPFKDHLIVTYSADSLMILDPETISVVAALYDVQKISALCVSKNEIFVLEGERHLMRLGFTPEETSYSSSSSPQNTSESISAQGKAFPIANQLLEFTAKIRESSIIPAIPLKKMSPIFSPTRSSGSSDGEQVSECMEAQELPPVLTLDSLDPKVAETVPELTVPANSFTITTPSEKEVYTRAQRSKGPPLPGSMLRSELLDKVGQEQFEDVVYKPKRKTRRPKMKPSLTNSIGAESGSDTTSVWSATSETDDAWTSERMDVSSEWSNISVSTSRRSSSEEPQSKLRTENEKSYASEEEDSVLSANHIQEKMNKMKLLKKSMESYMSRSRSGSTVQDEVQRPEYLPIAYPLNPNRDLDTIEKDNAEKERLIAKKYNLESVLGIDPEECIEKCDENTACDDKNVGNVEEESLLCNGSKTDSELDQSDVDTEGLSFVDSQERFLDEKMTSLSSTMSYGPPSGSSQLPSRHSSLELEPAGGPEDNCVTATIKGSGESSGWLQFTTPEPVICVSVCSHYLVALDAYNTVHYSRLDGLGLKWQRADCKASHMSLSPNASCVWRLHGGVAFALRNPAMTGPHGDLWVEAAKNIRSVAVGEDFAWLITQSGKVICQKRLTPSCPVSSCIDVNSDWPCTKVACYGQSVWVLSSTGEVFKRVGISSTKQEGTAWRRVNIPVPGSVQDIALGPQSTGWIIDVNNTVMFSVNLVGHEPLWWQVLISDYIFQQTSPLQQLRSCITLKNLRPNLPGRQVPTCSVASGKDSVWMCRNSSNILHANKTKFTGHRWTRVPLKAPSKNIRWQSVTAEGVFENKGQIWLRSDTGELFCNKPYTNTLKSVPLPSADGAVCLAAASQTLWLLSSSGEIYIRLSLSDSCLEGKHWRRLSLLQIEGVHFNHVSCGCDVVWACDTSGNMYMAVSSPHAMATSTFSPVWIPVENKEQNKIFFIKVFVGPQTFMVWALDNKGKVYVREAIFPDFQLGTGWVLVTGITALDLSISGTAVWALSADGDVYHRCGITQNNYIGDYWEKIPGAVEALTASMSDDLWGVDKNGLLFRHTHLTVNLNPTDGSPAIFRVPSVPGADEDGDWEVV